MKRLFFTMIAIFVSITVTANGQNHQPQYASAPQWAFGVPAYYRPATAFESYARGRADLIRAQAQYQFLISQAMKNAAEAERIRMENREKGVDTYFSMREKNRAHREAERNQRRLKYLQARQANEKNSLIATMGNPNSR
ncbi:MAG: hypothetical protein JW829_09090 [Pirellulales bacterium]|nr:hypothetical protein [Pirellulales bacterium]